MKIYVLMKQEYDHYETVCVSEDPKKIRTSICEDFDPEEDYPKLEIWEHGENIFEVSGSEVLKAVAKEIYRAPEESTPDWITRLLESLPNCQEKTIWSDGEEILVRTESAANAVADLIEQLYKSEGKDVLVNTGYYDPEEDQRNNEKDEYTGWWYIRME